MSGLDRREASNAQPFQAVGKRFDGKVRLRVVGQLSVQPDCTATSGQRFLVAGYRLQVARQAGGAPAALALQVSIEMIDCS